MSDTQPHGTRVRFWGGPSDGAVCEEHPATRWADPSEWWGAEGSGYRVGGLVRHRSDNSICAVAYVWREVWDE